MVRIAVATTILTTTHAIAYMSDPPALPFLGVW